MRKTDLIGPLLVAMWLLGGCASGDVEEAVQQGNQAFEALDFQEALAQYNRVLEADSRHAGAYLGRGKIYWFNNQHAQAIPEFDQALALAPDRMEAHYYRGISRMMLQQFDAGLADLEMATAVEVLPAEDLGRAYRFQGIGLMNLERYDEALAAFSQGIEHQPDWPLLYLDRAQLNEGLRRFEPAIADYEIYLTFGEEGSTQVTNTRARIAALRDSLSL